MKVTTHALDYEYLYPLHLAYDGAAQTLHLSIGHDNAPHQRLITNLHTLMECACDPASQTGIPTKTITGDGVRFHPVPPNFALRFGGQPFARYRMQPNGTLETRELRPMSASALRTLGTQHTSKARMYNEPQSFEEYDRLRQQAMDTVFTDFHTHSSGQISSEGLLAVAAAHNAYYPLHLLDGLGINIRRFPKALVEKRPRIPFPPLEPQKLPAEVDCIPLSSLSPDEQRTLARHMSLPTDRQSSFTDAEYDCYRLRYPFTKDNSLLKDSLKQMARESLVSGIRSAEISFVGLDKPDILRTVHEAIYEIERDPELKEFHLRLKVGIPRSFSQEQIKETLEKAKILAQSPYVVGVDFLGYEINKTTDFGNLLDEFFAWVDTNDPEFTTCVHAGENDKNPNNVKDVIRLAGQYDHVRIRIGHGLYGLDDEAIALCAPLLNSLKRPRLHIEANPDSNIALNNINDLRDMPFQRMLDHAIPFVVSSDSLGLYRTSGEQLARSLMQAGLDAKALTTLKQYQQHLETRQHAYVAAKATHIGDWHDPNIREQFQGNILQQLKQVPPAKGNSTPSLSYEDIQRQLGENGPIVIPDPVELSETIRKTTHSQRRDKWRDPKIQDLQKMLREKAPITILGASGTSWRNIAREHRREIALTLDMLSEVLNPEKAYIMQGRNKAEGVYDAANTAIKRTNNTSDAPFDIMGHLTDSAMLDPNTDYSHLSHIVRIRTPLNVADALVNHTVNHNGVLVAFGGAAFTRDAILKADRQMEERNKGLLFVMNGPHGASTEKSTIMDDSFCFRNGKELLQKLQQHYLEKNPDYFRPTYRRPFDEETLERLYSEASEHVGSRYGAPHPSNQRIEEIRQLNLPGLGRA